MLEPDTRELLLDLLRPPPGTALDQAIGTTYTLDLAALLVAPLAFAMFDWAVEDDGRPDPIAMLEALRRHAGRTTVFHQAGMIALPSWQPLLVHLEQSVVAVTPPNRHAIFHPKLWLLRFTDDDGTASFRLVVLSRNLTFDTSWDTVVVLEGRRRGQSQVGAKIADLLVSLAGRASRMSPGRADAVAAVASDVRDVVFDPPPDCDRVLLHVLGFDDAGPVLPTDADRAVVVSPFVTGDGVRRGLAGARSQTLVSRPESLDALPPGLLDGIDARVLNDGLVDDDTARATGRVVLTSDDEHRDDLVLRGLHAKLYGYESGGTTRLFTGSANATTPAFSGNVEVLVELIADRGGLSLDRLLEPGDGQASFGSLLIDHQPTLDDIDDEPGSNLASVLDAARREIGQLTFRAVVEPHGDDFRMTLVTDRIPQLPEQVTSVKVWRLAVGQGHAHAMDVTEDRWEIVYERIPLRGLTSFVAVEIRAEADDGRKDATRFAVTATMEGDPATRVDDVIASVLADRDDLLRYLLFLLADSGADAADVLAAAADGQTSGGATRGLFGAAPLLESMLTALARDPAKLDQVGRLIDDIQRTGRHELLPDGLVELWAAIDEARAAVEA
jgi:hypothetical protein